MVNSSIPMIVKRHRWMVSSSPTLGTDSGAQHNTAQATPQRGRTSSCHGLQHGQRVPSSPEDFQPWDRDLKPRLPPLTSLFVVGHNPRDMPWTRTQRTGVTSIFLGWTAGSHPGGRQRAWVTFSLAGDKGAQEGSGKLKAPRAAGLPGQHSFTQCKRKLN